MKTKRKVTETACRRFKCEEHKKQTDLSVGQPAGLYLRATRTGHKSWIFRFTPKQGMPNAGSRVEMKFADYGTKDPAMGLVDARLKANEYAGSLRQDRDPRVQQVINGEVLIPRSGRGPRLRDIYNVWIEDHAPGLAATTQALHRHQWNLTPDWIKDAHISSVKKAQINKLATQLRKLKTTNNQIRCRIQFCGTLCNWADQSGYEEFEDIQNPFTKYRIKIKKPKRSRTLTNNELRLLWHQGFGRTPMQTIARCVLLTGNRKTETLLARWSDIDLQKREWTLPATNVKTNYAHTIPFDSWLLEILTEHRETYGQHWQRKHPSETFQFATMPWGRLKGVRMNDFVFPYWAQEHFKHESNEKTYNTPHVQWKYYLRKDHGYTFGKDGTGFSIHDLRRTVGTRMKRLRVDGRRLHGDVTRAVLNHREAIGVTEQVYAPFEPQDVWPEHKQGLELWSQELRSIVEPDPTGGAKQKPKLTLLKRSA